MCVVCVCVCVCVCACVCVCVSGVAIAVYMLFQSHFLLLSLHLQASMQLRRQAFARQLETIRSRCVEEHKESLEEREKERQKKLAEEKALEMSMYVIKLMAHDFYSSCLSTFLVPSLISY